MKKYNWSQSILENKLNMLIDEIIKRGGSFNRKTNEIILENTNKESILLGFDISLLMNMIATVDKSFEYPILARDNLSLLEIYRESQEELEDISFAKEDILNFYKESTLFSSDITYEEQKTMNLKTDDILTIVHDFYKSLNPYFFKIFMKVFKQRKNNLKTFNKEDTTPFMGCSYMLSYLNETYIAIARTHDIEDIITFAHEYMHTINYSINPSGAYEKNKRYFFEIDTLFIELIITDYLRNLFKNNEADKANLITHLEYCNQVIYSSIIYTLTDYEKTNNTQLNSNKQMKELIKNTFRIKENIFEEIFQTSDIEIIIKYIISYMFAIELYLLYLNDKDKSLYILKKIIQAKGLSKEEYYKYIKSLGLYPSSSIHEYEEIIKSRTLKRTIAR